MAALGAYGSISDMSALLKLSHEFLLPCSDSFLKIKSMNTSNISANVSTMTEAMM